MWTFFHAILYNVYSHVKMYALSKIQKRFSRKVMEYPLRWDQFRKSSQQNIIPVIPEGLGRGVPNSTPTFYQLCLKSLVERNNRTQGRSVVSAYPHGKKAWVYVCMHVCNRGRAINTINPAQSQTPWPLLRNPCWKNPITLCPNWEPNPGPLNQLGSQKYSFKNTTFVKT